MAMKKFLFAFAVGFALTACTNTADSTCSCGECDTCMCTVDSVSNTVEVTDTINVVEEADSIVNE